MRTGKDKAEKIEASATYLEVKNTTIHIMKLPSKTSGRNGIKAPAEVAIPLPPLKPSQNV